LHLAVKSSAGQRPWKKNDDPEDDLLDTEVPEDEQVPSEDDQDIPEDDQAVSGDDTGNDGEDDFTVGITDPVDDPDESPVDEAMPADDPDDPAAPKWAGDLYEDGNETDPGQAFGSFRGATGEQAWLDKANDGVLTGWVRDADGSVWRYGDADAWAMDVDDAGMTPTSGPEAPTDPEPQPGQPQEFPEQKSIAYRLVVSTP
jgi:hypothetical protein